MEPKGQIVINERTNLNSIYLEEGDQIYIPPITNLANVQGEVSIPGTHTFVEGYSAYEYIQLTGGLTENADEKNILVIAQNGSVKKYESEGQLKKALIHNGDSILVMPEVSVNNLQMTKSITQIMYQIAVSVGVLLSILVTQYQYADNVIRIQRGGYFFQGNDEEPGHQIFLGG